jgi:thioredoxin 1
MEISVLTKKNFSTSVAGKGILVVYCRAPWCGVCRQFSPVLERVAERFPANTFTRLDTQAEGLLAQELGIEHVPALAVFRDGVTLFCRAGNYTEETVTDIIKQAESLDMKAVLAEAAADQGAVPEETKSKPVQ